MAGLHVTVASRSCFTLNVVSIFEPACGERVARRLQHISMQEPVPAKASNQLTRDGCWTCVATRVTPVVLEVSNNRSHKIQSPSPQRGFG